MGWRLFLAPPSALPPSAATARPQAAAVQTREALVQATGTPAAVLGSAVRVGAAAPDFSLPGLTGESIRLSDLRGQVVLVNFWTTWCPPCREEMPALQQVYERLGERGLVVLGVNWTQVDDPQAVEPFARELGLTFPILLDRYGAVSEELYQILGLPTSILIDRDGTVRLLRIGVLDMVELQTTLETLLAEQS